VLVRVDVLVEVDVLVAVLVAVEVLVAVDVLAVVPVLVVVPALVLGVESELEPPHPYIIRAPDKTATHNKLNDLFLLHTPSNNEIKN
jgi:hypothetical protein